ncbi:MAG: prepilin peptidase [Bdellovibrionia bacterium]
MDNINELITHLLPILFGLIIGSFLNVVILRTPVGESCVRPKSRCPKCQHPIPWKDKVPVFSYLMLLGKCRFCQCLISPRYLVIELLTALLFYACRVHFGWDLLLFIRYWPLMAIFVAITFIDLDHQIIPDFLNLGVLLIGLLTSGFVPEVGFTGSILGMFFGFFLFYALASAYERLRNVSGLGGGDIKLLAGVGALLGIKGVLSTVFISSILGSVAGVAWALSSQKGDSVLKIQIPYGPFLVLGALTHTFFGEVLWLQSMIPM